MKTRTVLFGLLFLSLVIPVSTFGQNGFVWVQKNPAHSPTPRILPAMAYDESRGKVVLFGGVLSDFSTYLNDTWEWDGIDWHQVASTGPAVRYHHSMVYDRVSKKIVMFGGANNNLSTAYNDTWEWNGTTWTQVAATGPANRKLHRMVYDPRRKKVLLFGGQNYVGSLYGDTWEWDGNSKSWTQVSSTGPGARSSYAMCYDAANGKVLLFGGDSGSPTSYNDTWEWDGTNWSQLSVSGPGSRCYHCMVYHFCLNRVILYGGFMGGTQPYLDDTWEWDGETWTQVSTPGALKHINFDLSYDIIRGKIVLFGGRDSSNNFFNDTWEFGKQCGDIDTDGDVDATDAMFLEQYLVGLRSTLPCN